MDNKLPTKKDNEAPGFFSRLLNTLVGIGLGESILRAGTTLLSIILLGAVIFLMKQFYARTPEEGSVNALQTGPTAPVASMDEVPSQSEISFGGIPRLAQVHTTIPSRPRQEVVKYTVLEEILFLGSQKNSG